MKVNSLELVNFKGITNFKLECEGKSTNIYGANATGKTTIFDAITWLLFGKNSQGKESFGIKTIIAGATMHHAEHSVTAEFSHNGDVFTLKKVYKEKWVKSIGKLEPEFTGNTTECFIDDVPKKISEYQKFVANIVNEDIFKLLTDPLYFNEKLSWQKRREVLLKLCGDITPEEVIGANAELAALIPLMKNKSIDDVKTMVKASVAKTKKDIERIAPAIEENIHNMVEVTGDKEVATKELEKVSKAIDKLHLELTKIEENDPRTKAVEKLKSDMERKDIALRKNMLDELDTLPDSLGLSDINNILDKGRQQLVDLQTQKKVLEATIGRCLVTRSALIQSFGAEKAKVFETKEVETNCPYCGQSLPELKVAEVKNKQQKALENFNLAKADKLKQINAEGKRNNEERDQAEKELQTIETKITACNAEILTANTQLDSYNAKVGEVKEKWNLAIEVNRDEYMAAIANEESIAVEGKADIQLEKINELKKEKEQIEEVINNINSNQKLIIRNEELRNKEESLSAMFAELSKQLYLVDAYIRTRTDLIDKTIAAKFKLAHFMLFKDNISNDGIEECCETCVNGIPYSDLNKAMKVNVGLDIIMVLSQTHNFTAPVVIDNAESVTDLLDMGDIQLIRLIVSQNDKKLRVEKGE